MTRFAITGSTGELGGRVARRLAERGATQRLIVRDAARAPQLDGAELAIASGYGAQEEMRAALEGTQTLYFVSGREERDRVEQHRTLVRAAAAAGVARIVYTSFANAAPDATFTLARHHWATEQAIREAGLAFTFLRGSLYLDWMPLLAGPDHVIRGPAGDGRVAPVARDDLADAAATVLLAGGEHDGRAFDLTGPELMTLEEVARRLSAFTRESYAYVPETPEEAWQSRRALGAEDWVIEGWVSSYLAIADGSLAMSTDEVERLTGRPPQRLEDCLRAHPELLDPS